MHQDIIDNWFSYHAPDAVAATLYNDIRAAGLACANVINQSCPDSADKTAAIRKLREAIMTANASVACGGK